MRATRSILAAVAVAAATALASLSPAQATAIKAAPLASVETADSGVELVHKRRYRHHGGHYRRYGHRRHYRHYGYRRHYSPYAYYDYPRYYRRPGITFQFGFGGGGHHGYGYGY